jgi:3-methylcrotonyl-CoA carboxylase alpha subunit
MSGKYARTFSFTRGEMAGSVIVNYGGNSYRMEVGRSSFAVSGEFETDGSLSAVVDGRRLRAQVINTKERLHVFTDGKRLIVRYNDPLDVETEHGGKEGGFLAPMPGRVIAQSVQPGERVEKGAALMVLEAMKMECTIHAPSAGSVASFHFNVGDQVNEGAVLLRFDRTEEGK